MKRLFVVGITLALGIMTAKKNNQLINKTNNNAAPSTNNRPQDVALIRFSKKICTIIFYYLAYFILLNRAGKRV